MSDLSVIGLGAAVPSSWKRAPTFLRTACALAALLTSRGASGGDVVLGIALPEPKDAWSSCREQSIADAAKQSGVKLLREEANDAAKQASQIDNLIARKVTVLAVAPIDRRSIGSVLSRARTAGIPVLLLDTDAEVDGSLYRVLIGPDPAGQGSSAAGCLATSNGGGAQQANLTAIAGPDPALTHARRQGFEAAWAGRGTARIEQLDAGSDPAEALKQASQSGRSQVRGVLADGDAAALAALQGIKAAGQKPGQDVPLVAIGGWNDQVLEALKERQITCLVEDSAAVGPLLLRAVAALQGKGDLPRHMIIGHRVIKSQDAEAYRGSRCTASASGSGDDCCSATSCCNNDKKHCTKCK